MGAWESFWRSVRRNLRSLGRALSSPTGRIADEAIAGWGRVLELGEQAVADRDAAERERQYALAELAAVRGQRHAAVDALREMSEGVRLALVDGGYFHSVDPVAGVRRMAADYVKTVAELRAARDKAAEVDRLTLALDAARLRPSDTSDQDRRNCVDMSDQLAAVRRDFNDLERNYNELKRAAEPFGVSAP